MLNKLNTVELDQVSGGQFTIGEKTHFRLPDSEPPVDPADTSGDFGLNDDDDRGDTYV